MRALVIPDEIIAFVDKLHELGPAAEGIQRAIFSVVAANELVTLKVIDGRCASGFAAGLPSHLIWDKTRFYDLMWNALGGLIESQNRIEALFKQQARPSTS